MWSSDNTMDEDKPGPSSSAGSSSRLPPLSTLASWVHRPAAVAKCFVSDVYAMRPLLQAGAENMRYAGRDVFMLGTVPCKVVEVVAWVSGITQRENFMIVYLDDGDGSSVLPVTVKLKLVQRPSATALGKRPQIDAPLSAEGSTASHFLSARERKEAKRKLALEEFEKAQAKKAVAMKVFERKDIRVGDTVRIVGRVDEWSRAKPGGAVQWVRELVVEEGSGGSIAAVYPEEQFSHAEEVLELHRTRYVRPFVMPPLFTLPCSSTPFASPSKINTTVSTMVDSMDVSSEMPSELSTYGDLSLRPPSELRSSQLTDRTFRQYLLDHISQASSSAMAAADLAAVNGSLRMLEDSFPEYQLIRRDKGKGRIDDRILRATSPNSQSFDSTPLASRYYKSTLVKTPTVHSTPSAQLMPWTVSSILEVPHLQELARLVVDSEAKREERRRRRRIRDGQARPKDLEIEQSRVRSGRKADDWHLRTSEKERRMQKLVGWCIRGMHEDGGLVQVDLRTGLDGDLSLCLGHSDSIMSTASSLWSNSIYKQDEQFGYICLAPPLVLPLLLPLFEAEREKRGRVFLSKDDPRKGSGMTVAEALSRLRCWGTEGRWERVGEWVVEEAIDLGVRRGMLRREGRGWWATEEV